MNEGIISEDLTSRPPPIDNTLVLFVDLGALLTFSVVAAIWFADTWYAGHLPISLTRVFNNTVKRYNVALTVSLPRSHP